MIPIARIHLPQRLLQEMEDAALAAWPLEACGLLLGRFRSGPAGSVDAEIDTLRFRPTGNAAAEPRHGYVVPPLELLEADREARVLGLEIVGVWHSHPEAPALPSRRDIEEAWEGYAYGIHAVRAASADGQARSELRFFELQAGAMKPIPLLLTTDPPGDPT